ncbi:HNH endonuclease [Plebeiibacterium sediminum]|uniref:Uncharacterized protein n=1 Tax=Plebeiibacterium sediminum TaxID=2992112 RepID=A0AAE3M9Y2_9BACT|nr:hypothetical protein [Plebeiobacterium sediminum]MCW3789657.1 hypothetical protein [Plebeiobacterium sediminum]
MLKIEIRERTKMEKSFFEHLNPVGDDKMFLKSSVIQQLKSEYDNAALKVDKDIYRFLIIRIKNILIGNPKVLSEIISLFDVMFSLDVFYEVDAVTDKKKDSEIAKKIKSIFNYKAFRSSPFCISYLRELGFEARIPCPYCNFDELSIVTRDVDKNDLALLDLDHFVPQSKYPFLALSMYNLVPSCHNCNSRFKRETLFLVDTHINPFDKSFDDNFHFSLKTPYVFGMDIKDFIISYDSLSDFSDKTIIDLELIERYNTAKDKLIEKFNILSKMTSHKTNEIEILLEQTVNDEILELAEIPKNKEDITSYSLGKLKRDIYKDTWENN